MKTDTKNPGQTRGPIVIELDDLSGATPAQADPVPEGILPQTPVQIAAQYAARKPSNLGRWLLWLGLSLVGFFASLTAWSFITGLIASNPILGAIATALVTAFVLVLLIVALKEILAIARLGRIDRLQHRAQTARADADLKAARSVVKDLGRFYRGRDELRWGQDQMATELAEILDADGTLDSADRNLLHPLDAAASRQVEAASRQVATVTALVPLALADVFTALTANLRMIRQIAEIYGGRSGTLGSWRLARAVLAHLVATGAVAIGDDLVGSLAGGSILSKLSRRFGEGLVNGALTARVGVAAIEVCRPLPFHATKRPSVTKILQRSLTGLFDKDA